jgi:nuclear pore complex protein Nup155
VRPKEGIFSHDINYILVIATPVEIVLLGCSFGGNNVNGELSLYETHFYVPTDNIPIAKVIGTATGRIFMCGLDGCLYELDYQNEESWFRAKCRKLNHSRGVLRSYLPQILYFGKVDEPMVELLVDETRRPPLLYTFSRNDKTNKSTLTMYSLGKNGDEMKEVCCNKQSVADIIKKATGQSLSKTKTWLVSLTTIPNYDTESLLLVGVTNQGIRIFYTMKTNRYGKRELLAQLVRLCPPYVKLSHQQNQKSEYSRKPEYKEDCSPKNVKKAYYHKGILLMADASSDRSDTMIAITPEHVQSGSKEGGVGPRGGLNELVHTTGQFQFIYDLSEKSEEFYLFGQPGSYANFLYAGVGKGQAYDMPIRGLRELAVQHVLPNRQFICLTSNGIQTYEKMWPVDELRAVCANGVYMRICVCIPVCSISLGLLCYSYVLSYCVFIDLWGRSCAKWVTNSTTARSNSSSAPMACRRRVQCV